MKIRRSKLLLPYLSVAILFHSEAVKLDASETLELNPLEAFELPKFEVKASPIRITVEGRNPLRRQYAENFANDIAEALYETLEGSPGDGLVIISSSRFPHPFDTIRSFIELTKNDPNLSHHKPLANKLSEVHKQIDRALEKISGDTSVDKQEALAFIKSTPLPLSGAIGKIFWIAHQEDFNQERFATRLASIELLELKSNAICDSYAWALYLTPKAEMQKATKQFMRRLAKSQKKGKGNSVASTALSTLLKPMINDAVEASRKSAVYEALLNASDKFTDAENLALSIAYRKAIMPHANPIPGQKNKRAIEAIKEQKRINLENRIDPFILPDPLRTFDHANYHKLLGYYGPQKKPSRSFKLNDNGSFSWNYKDKRSSPVLPAGPNLFVSQEKKFTLEFQWDESGTLKQVEYRSARIRKIRRYQGPNEER